MPRPLAAKCCENGLSFERTKLEKIANFGTDIPPLFPVAHPYPAPEPSVYLRDRPVILGYPVVAHPAPHIAECYLVVQCSAWLAAADLVVLGASGCKAPCVSCDARGSAPQLCVKKHIFICFTLHNRMYIFLCKQKRGNYHGYKSCARRQTD